MQVIPEVQESVGVRKDTIAEHREAMKSVSGQEARLKHLARILEAETKQEKAQETPVISDTPEIQEEKRVVQESTKKLAHMDPEIKKRIIESMRRQEEDWDKIPIKDIQIEREEVSMWWNIFGLAKKADFKKVDLEKEDPRKLGILYNLERGEIANLTIDGFVLFQIVKIRSKNKGIYAMCVIRFQRPDMPEPKERDYMVSIPLIEWQGLHILDKQTQETLVMYKVKELEVNSENKTFVHAFLNFSLKKLFT